MGEPRATLNKATLSVGFQAKYGVVKSITSDGLYALVVDRQNTETRVPMLVQRSKAPLPAVGETWLIDQALGAWTFAAFVAQDPGQFTGTAQYDVSQYDSSSITITQATGTPGTIAWGIPAGTTKAGTIYELVTSGRGTWASPATVLGVDIGIDGHAVSGGNNLNSATFTAGQPFYFELTGRVIFTAAGNSGSYLYLIKLVASATTAGAQGGYTMLRRATGKSLDTTADHTMELLLSWGTIAGSPVLTCDGSTFQRKGA